MIVAVLFVAAVIALIGWPSSVYLWYQIRRVPLPSGVQLAMIGCFSTVIAMSIAAWLLGMRTGVKALEELQ